MVDSRRVSAAQLALSVASCSLTDLERHQNAGGQSGTSCSDDDQSTALIIRGRCYRRVREPAGRSAARALCQTLFGEAAHLATGRTAEPDGPALAQLLTGQFDGVAESSLYPLLCEIP